MLSQPFAGTAKEPGVQPRRQVAHDRLYQPYQPLPKRHARVKLPQAFKRHFCSSPFWLTQQTGAHLAEMRLLQKEQEGRAETEGEGSCHCLGKLAALHKRFLLSESSQGAAIIPSKGNRTVLGILGSWIKCFALPVYHVLQVESLWNTDIEENQKRKIAMNPNKGAYLERCCSNSLQKSSSSPHVIMGSICLRVRRVLRTKGDSRATDFISNICSCVNVDRSVSDTTYLKTNWIFPASLKRCGVGRCKH